MGNTIKVRVNPTDPSQYALLLDPSDTYSPWYKKGTTYDGWCQRSKVENWVEYSLDVPEPPRQFKAGDVVKTQSSSATRVRDDAGYWRDMTGSVMSIYDNRVRERLDPNYSGTSGRLVFVGNVADLK